MPIFGGRQMKYRVQHMQFRSGDDPLNLERFLNSLEGEVVSILPIIKKTSLAQIYGVTEKVDFLLIVEKIEN